MGKLKIVIAFVVALCMHAYCAISIPATRSGYSFVDVSDIDITGNVYPARKAAGTDLVLRAEDVACIAEAVCERDCWLNFTNATQSLYSPAPSFVLSSNLISRADEFFGTMGRGLSAASYMSDSSETACFIDKDWNDSNDVLEYIDVAEVAGAYSVTDLYCIGAMFWELSPTIATVSRLRSQGILSASDIEGMYNNIGATRRVFAGNVGIKPSGSTYFSKPNTACVIYVQGGTTQYLYDAPDNSITGEHGQIVTRSYDYWYFGRGCWSNTSKGRCSPYSWTTTTDAPRVVLRPVFTGIVSIATLYLTVKTSKIMSSVGGNDTYNTIIGFIRVPLTRVGSVSVNGVTCDEWTMPEDMKNSQTILGDALDAYNANLPSSGLPCINDIHVSGGMVDLLLSPRIDTLDDGD